MSSDLISIVGEEYAEYWDMMIPRIYYKDSVAHGVIATVRDMDCIIVFSMSKDNVFTVGMLRDIITMWRVEDKMILVTDDSDSFGWIKSKLTPYGFEFIRQVNEHGKEFMYSIHVKDSK